MDSTIALWQHTASHVIYPDKLFWISVKASYVDYQRKLEGLNFKFEGSFPSLSWILLSASMSC